MLTYVSTIFTYGSTTYLVEISLPPPVIGKKVCQRLDVQTMLRVKRETGFEGEDYKGVPHHIFDRDINRGEEGERKRQREAGVLGV
jgi:hypothetical protein